MAIFAYLVLLFFLHIMREGAGGLKRPKVCLRSLWMLPNAETLEDKKDYNSLKKSPKSAEMSNYDYLSKS